MAQIGAPVGPPIHIEPAPIPEQAPVREPSPVIMPPAETPSPEREPELVPA